MRCHERSARALLCVRRRYPPKRGGEFLSKALLGEVDILGMRSKGTVHRLGGLAVTPGRQSLEWTSTDGRRACGALMSTSHGFCHDHRCVKLFLL